jgi:hypothetical protein
MLSSLFSKSKGHENMHHTDAIARERQIPHEGGCTILTDRDRVQDESSQIGADQKY